MNAQAETSKTRRKPSALTKRSCKSVLGSLHDLGVTEYELIVEGNGFRVIVGSVPKIEDDIAKQIDGIV
ncbi:MAG: hypothetical protein COA69_00045 [Robiginitomaculum sp.]|nr:MAG: hypothetical protein COA69_00045 [Robiginitomaculum sp.]